jgi:hypothetical protein
MFKTLLSSVYVYLVVAVISSLFSGYLVYNLTSDYYSAKIEHANNQAIKEKDEIQQKGDRLVAEYVQQINRLGSVNTSLQKQVPAAVRVNSDPICTVSSGFVRLYNASATGETSSPSGTDGTASEVDLTALLDTLIENNTKYNKVAQQLIELQTFENSK